MPLRGASGLEAEKYLEAGRKADSSLLRGLAAYFEGIAIVEASDIRGPDAGQLKSAAKHLDSARNHLRESSEAAKQMLRTIPSHGSKEFEEIVRLRLQSSIANTEGLERAFSTIEKHLGNGKYPALGDCDGALIALEAVFATFRVNAQTHKAEGF